MSADKPEFNHFTPSAYLLRNLELLMEETDEVSETLERFERAFHELNGLL
jgi:hypothetical protein